MNRSPPWEAGVFVESDPELPPPPSTLPPPTPEPPWTSCACRGTGIASVTEEDLVDPAKRGKAACTLCHGLGFTIPDDWLETSWAISFLIPAESLAKGQDANAFLDMILGPVYPSGGYTILPLLHPRFEEAMSQAIDQMKEQGILFERAEKKVDLFLLRTDNQSNGAWVGRHLRVVLLEKSPR